MLARVLSFVFVASIVLCFFSLKLASLSIFVFILLAVMQSMLSGNRPRLFVSSIFLFLFFILSFFIHFKYFSGDMSSGAQQTVGAKGDKNTATKNRLLQMRTMMKDENTNDKDLLSYTYDSITLAESLATSTNPEGYLYLGYIYDSASLMGIESAKSKSRESFARYCDLIPNGEVCGLVH